MRVIPIVVCFLLIAVVSVSYCQTANINYNFYAGPGCPSPPISNPIIITPSPASNVTCNQVSVAGLVLYATVIQPPANGNITTCTWDNSTCNNVSTCLSGLSGSCVNYGPYSFTATIATATTATTTTTTTTTTATTATPTTTTTSGAGFVTLSPQVAALLVMLILGIVTNFVV